MEDSGVSQSPTAIFLGLGIPTFLICSIQILFLICVTCYIWKRYIKKQDGKEKQSQDIRHKEELERRKDIFKENWTMVNIYPDWRKELFQPLEVTLDPDTAHPELIVSEDRRRVFRGKGPQDLANTDKRFDSLHCVLGLQNITSHRYYWEVEVGNKPDWDLGVCGDNVKRKGHVTVSPENSFWGIRLYNDEYWALTSTPTSLSLKEKPRTICVFLDYDFRNVAFYNMTDNSHIYTFSSLSFYGALCPFFRLWSSDSEPLIMSRIENRFLS